LENVRNEIIKKQVIILSTLEKIDSKRKMVINVRFRFSRIKYTERKRKSAERQSGVERRATAVVNMEYIIKAAAGKAITSRKYFLSQ
jgi:hypothetical protein